MWRGRIMEWLGVGLIAVVALHLGSHLIERINIATGVLIFCLAFISQLESRWLGYIAGGAGVLLVIIGLISGLTRYHPSIWLDGLVGAVIWFCGWRIVVSERPGPWRIRDRPNI